MVLFVLLGDGGFKRFPDNTKRRRSEVRAGCDGHLQDEIKIFRYELDVHKYFDSNELLEVRIVKKLKDYYVPIRC